MVFPGATTRRRHLALVTLWNSNDSWFAFEQLAKYAFHFFGSGSDFVYGLIFCLLAFVIYGGSLSLGIVGPSLMQIGTVAPVRPGEVYYPSAAVDDSSGFENFGILAPACFRALGGAEASQITMTKKVNLGLDDLGQLDDGQHIYRYPYSYSLTGVDLGLQHGSDLARTVTGSCITEYGWISDSTGDTSDIYHCGTWKVHNLQFQSM